MPKKKRKKRFLPRILKWIGMALFVFVILSVLQVVLLRFINPPFTVMSAWERIRNMGSGKEVASIEEWRPLNEIAPHIRKAILAGEDQRFLSHNGFDFTEINEAMRDMVSRKGLRGASTISMQTARTVFLWPARSLLRKILEAYYTVLVEIFWTKERILEIYLNTVDWGKGIMGVEAASRTYFHISSAHVSRRQAALLAAILPSPHRWSPSNPNPYVLKRQRRILKDINKMPLVSYGN
ncbi:MAG: monofunctional biosynthetic peptidoglycan transglycosylase [Desulfobacteraceae bacterium]|nr:monofunctional biosynthetic peptidoglycan transglycosylase [Desulfobacteraceae bacterium]